MTEFLLRAVGPSLVVVVEREGPTRLFTTLTGESDVAALEAWIGESEPRQVLVAAALRDRASTGGSRRGLAWARSLARTPGGIMGLIERLAEGKSAPTNRA